MVAVVTVTSAWGSCPPHSSALEKMGCLCSFFRQLVQTMGFLPSFPDFDECTVYGTCSQTCTNTEGSYTCSCVEGYLLQPDNRSCKAKNGEILDRSVLLLGSSANRGLLPYVYPCPWFFTSRCSSLRTVLCYHVLAPLGLHVAVLFSLEQKGRAAG